jgi:hypothetical protein
VVRPWRERAWFGLSLPLPLFDPRAVEGAVHRQAGPAVQCAVLHSAPAGVDEHGWGGRVECVWRAGPAGAGRPRGTRQTPPPAMPPRTAPASPHRTPTPRIPPPPTTPPPIPRPAPSAFFPPLLLSLLATADEEDALPYLHHGQGQEEQIGAGAGSRLGKEREEQVGEGAGGAGWGRGPSPPPICFPPSSCVGQALVWAKPLSWPSPCVGQALVWAKPVDC